MCEFFLIKSKEDILPDEFQECQLFALDSSPQGLVYGLQHIVNVWSDGVGCKEDLPQNLTDMIWLDFEKNAVQAKEKIFPFVK